MARLLIVDDSVTERDYLRDMLVKAGHVVITASSGREAVEVAQREQPDLVFMDIVMDDVDGYHATRTLKENPATVAIPVVVVSSKNQKADKMWAQLQGAKGYVVKPCKAEEILQHVETLTASASSAQ